MRRVLTGTVSPGLWNSCVLLFGLVCLAGCSGGDEEKVVAVSGKILKGGQAWSLKDELGNTKLPPGDSGGNVVFTRKNAGAGKEGLEYKAVLNATNGTFTVPGTSGNGIPPGDYEVVVYVGSFGGGGPPGGGGGVPGGAPKAAKGGGMYGKEVGRKTVAVPEAGLNNLVIELPK